MVLGLIAKLLITGQLKFEGGVVSLKDITMNILPSILVVELTKYFDKRKKLPILYFLAWYGGFVLVKQVKDKFKLKTPEEVYSFGMDLAEAMGTGLYKTHDYYPGRFTRFFINSPYVKYFDSQEKRPMDYFIAGAMGGGGCHVHNAVCQTIELKCMLQGYEQCEFLTGTEKELKKRGLWSIAVKRYNLKKIYRLQKEIFKSYREDKEKELLEKVIKEL